MNKQESNRVSSTDLEGTREDVQRAGEDVQIRGAGGDIQCKEVVDIVDSLAPTIAAVTAILSTAGGMKMLLEMVKLWVESRKERRIKLKTGDIELELQGSMSQKEIQSKIQLFRELTKDAKESDVKIIVP
jgi:hypothetical protein